MKATLAIAIGASVVPFAFAAFAQENKYQITAFEKAACTADAARFCSHTYPDEDRLLDCLRTNVGNLSLVCSVSFKAGLKRRHIPL